MRIYGIGNNDGGCTHLLHLNMQTSVLKNLPWEGLVYQPGVEPLVIACIYSGLEGQCNETMFIPVVLFHAQAHNALRSCINGDNNGWSTQPLRELPNHVGIIKSAF